MVLSKRVLAAACIAFLWVGAQSVSAQLSAVDRTCSDQAAKATRNVANQAQKASRGCVKHGVGDITSCLDTEGGGAAGKRAELVALFAPGDACATVPAFGLNADPNKIADAVEVSSARIIRDVFGNPPNGVPEGDKCSDKIAQRAGKKFDTIFKNFRKCAKHLPTIDTVVDLESCVPTAVAGTATSQAKLDGDVAEKCSPIPPAGTNDGACAGETTPAGFSACIGRKVNCEACVTINAMIGGSADCDVADDGLSNASCFGTQTCTLGPTSKMNLSSSLGNQVLLPTGTIDINCASPGPDGTAACTCSVKSFGPVNVGGQYWACLKPPTTTCPALKRDCDGGSSLNYNLAGRRNVGSCTSNADCATQCATFCGGAANVFDSGCEGFCSDGAQMACTTDVQCGMAGQGACNGPNSAGHTCDCACLTTVASPAARVGAISCQLAFNLTIEALPGDNMPCDGGVPGDGDVLIAAGNMCAPLSTEIITGQITNGNNAGSSFPASPYSKSGMPIACTAFDAGTTAGLRFAGDETLFALPTGDLFAGLEAVCQ